MTQPAVLPTRTPVEDLSAACVDVTATRVDSWQQVFNEDFSASENSGYWQSFWHLFTAEDDSEHTLIVATRDGQSVAVEIDGERVDLDDPQNWIEDHPDSLTKADFQALAELEPHQWGAEGPMMNYWYALNTDDEHGIGPYTKTVDTIEAALRLAHANLCLVQVNGEFGLALTGGGMDMTWSIVQAFCQLGYLPPTAYCNNPGFAGPARGDQDYLLAAMRRSLSVQVQRLQSQLEQLG